MIAKSEADLDYARSLKDDVLKMCIAASDTNKIKLSEVKDQFKTIPLHILGIVMEVLCGDKSLISNAMGRMTLYSVPVERLNQKQIVAPVTVTCEKGKQLKDKENVIPKGMQIAKKTVQPAGKKRKELSIHDNDDSSVTHHTSHHSSSAGPSIVKKTTAAAKKSKTQPAVAEPSNKQQQQSESKKSQQVVLSAANRSLMTYSPGPLNQEAQKATPPSQDSTNEADIEIFDGMVEVTSLSAFSQSLTQKDPSFTKQQVDSCLHHLEMKNKIMIFDDEIYLI